MGSRYSSFCCLTVKIPPFWMHKRRESPHYRPPMDRLIEKITNKNVKNHLAMIRQLIDCLLFYIFTTPFSVCLFFFLRKRFGGVCAVRGRPRRKNLFFFFFSRVRIRNRGRGHFSSLRRPSVCVWKLAGSRQRLWATNFFLPRMFSDSSNYKILCVFFSSSWPSACLPSIRPFIGQCGTSVSLTQTRGTTPVRSWNLEIGWPFFSPLTAFDRAKGRRFSCGQTKWQLTW